MKFQAIFKKSGLYRADGFAKGVAYKVDSNAPLKIVTYQAKDDLFPQEEIAPVFSSCFEKYYWKVLNTSQLFE